MSIKSTIPFQAGAVQPGSGTSPYLEPLVGIEPTISRLGRGCPILSGPQRYVLVATPGIEPGRAMPKRF